MSSVNARVASLHHQDGDIRYVIYPRTFKVGDSVDADSKAPKLIGVSFFCLTVHCE